MEQLDVGTIRWVIGIMGTAIVSLVVATWRTALLSKKHEDGINDTAAIKLHLFGDALQGKKGALDDVKEAKDAALASARAARLIYRALRVPTGASEEEVIAHIREILNGAEVLNTGQYPAMEPPHHPKPPSKPPEPRKALKPFKPPIDREDKE